MVSSAEKTTKVAPVQQKAAGNHFFRKAGEESFFQSQKSGAFFQAPVQAKLSVSSPGDPKEKEADAVADTVMRMPDSMVPRDTAGKMKSSKKRTKKNRSHQ